MKWYWFGLVAVIVYWLWDYSKTVKQMLRLQKLAQSYPIEFQLFVEKEEGWEVFDMSHNGKGCIKLIPEPQIGSEYYYYIKFSGSISERNAIDHLIHAFEYYIHYIRKIQQP